MTNWSLLCVEQLSDDEPLGLSNGNAGFKFTLLEATQLELQKTSYGFMVQAGGYACVIMMDVTKEYARCSFNYNKTINVLKRLLRTYLITSRGNYTKL